MLALFLPAGGWKSIKSNIHQVKKGMPFKTLYELALELKLPEEIINIARELRQNL